MIVKYADLSTLQWHATIIHPSLLHKSSTVYVYEIIWVQLSPSASVLEFDHMTSTIYLSLIPSSNLNFYEAKKKMKTPPPPPPPKKDTSVCATVHSRYVQIFSNAIPSSSHSLVIKILYPAVVSFDNQLLCLWFHPHYFIIIPSTSVLLLCWRFCFFNYHLRIIMFLTIIYLCMFKLIHSTLTSVHNYCSSSISLYRSWWSLISSAVL